MIKSHVTMHSILNNLMSDIIGGDINSDACVVKKDSIELHFWNGERLLIKRLPNGCAYDPNTGSPLPVNA